MENLKRKKSMIFMALMMCVCAFTATSCIGDDDENPYVITEQEYNSFMVQMAGTYSSRLYFYNDTITKNDKTDSAFVSTRFDGIGDSIITVTGIPASCLARLVKNEQAKAALQSYPSISLQSKFYLSQKNNNVVQFGVYPLRDIEFNVEYGGDLHTITFELYRYLNYSGQYYQNTVVFDLYITNIRIDGNLDRALQVTGTGQDANCILRVYGSKF